MEHPKKGDYCIFSLKYFKECVKVCKDCKKYKDKRKDISKETNRSIYEKEILFKIEEFRLARSKWLASKKGSITKNMSHDADFKESNSRKGRHFKTVRPLPYFTLRKKLSASEILEIEEKERLKLEKQLAAEKDEFEDFYIEELEFESKKSLILDDKKKEGMEIVQEKDSKKKGPSKKAIENLKAAKAGGGLVESLKCNDGKEITVVIKGFCLCDKDNIRKFKLNKIRDDYQKLEKSKVEPIQEEIKPQITDSLLVHKKRGFRKSAKEKENEEYENAVPDLKLGKHVSFTPKKGSPKKTSEKPQDDKEKKIEIEPRKVEKDSLKENQEEIKKQEKREEEVKRGVSSKKKIEKQIEEDLSSSLVTLYKNQTPNRSDMGLTKEQYEKLQQTRN